MATELREDMHGKIAVVTGATGGIGKEIARGLARMGATLVIPARSQARGDAAREEIARTTGNGDLHVMPLDVADQASIRAFAASFRSRFDRLHVLVNNAGAWFSDRRTSPDGLELTFATNVVGPYLLTSLLEAPLRAAAPARVVNLVSGLAANYDATDLDFTRRGYDGFKVYAASKLAARMLTWAQSAALSPAGVTVNAAAPGFVRTDFNQNAKGFVAAMIGLSVRLFGSTPAEGADTPLWAAVAPELAGVTARYFEARKEKDGKFRDPEAIAELQRTLERLTANRGAAAAA